MSAAEPPGNLSWRERRRLSISAMRDWNVRQWEIWWGEGLDIWFSDFSRADRLEAFAPFQIMPGQEEPDDRLPQLLYELYGPEWGVSAADSLRIQDAIEAGAVRVAGNRRYMSTFVRAALLVRAFSGMAAKSTGDLLRFLIMADAREWMGGEGGDELASAISYALFDLAHPNDLDDARLHFEDMIQRRRSFRPALYYAMKLHSNYIECLETFERLWISRPAFDVPEVWREIAGELRTRYGERVVASGLREVLETEDVCDMDGYLVAVRLSPFFPRPAENPGLFDKAWGSSMAPVEVSATRGLSTENYYELQQMEEMEFYAAG